MIVRLHHLWVAAWLAVVVGLPLWGSALRRAREGRCALDGLLIERAYQVRIVEASGTTRAFCCLGCAQQWLRTTPRPQQIYVTDEVSGREVTAARAYYVRSTVIVQPATGSHLHAFARRDDAERHANMAGGTLLSARDGPFPPNHPASPPSQD